MVFFSTGVTSVFVFRFIFVLSASLSCRLYKLVNSPAELCECGAAVLEAALGGGDGSGGRSAALGWVGDGGELLALFAEGGGGGAGALAELCGAGADLAGGGHRRRCLVPWVCSFVEVGWFKFLRCAGSLDVGDSFGGLLGLAESLLSFVEAVVGAAEGGEHGLLVAGLAALEGAGDEGHVVAVGGFEVVDQAVLLVDLADDAVDGGFDLGK